jgi:hypothetical protein
MERATWTYEYARKRLKQKKESIYLFFILVSLFLQKIFDFIPASNWYMVD